MNWLTQIHATQPVAHAIGIIALVCAAGMILGSARVRGITLGASGVLFVGLLAGHFGKPVDEKTLSFVKEFGLVLFVFTLGLQLGPGFFAALRSQGPRMITLALTLVLLGALSAPALGWLARFDPAAVIGIFSGASINMPSLGAALQAMQGLPGFPADRLALPALACAVTFPTAILAVVGALLLLERFLGMDPVLETQRQAEERHRQVPPLERRTLVLTRAELAGSRIGELVRRAGTAVTVSRLRRAGETSVALDSNRVQLGDRLLAIGSRSDLDALESLLGERSEEDLVQEESQVRFRRVVVTERSVLGRALADLHLEERLGVVVTRFTRADLELTAVPNLRLQFGDLLQVVGHEADLDRAAAALGNSVHELSVTQFVPFFGGILAGILVGTLPIHVPGFPEPLRLGLAGGPLLTALLMGRFGRLGRWVFHMPVTANLAFREFGIALFFAAVGLEAGPRFFATVMSPLGWQWLAAGLAVTLVPILAVGAFARVVFRLRYADLAGLIAGAMTAPPALAFASARARSDAPTVAYAMVYPLAMVARVLGAQALVLILCR